MANESIPLTPDKIQDEKSQVQQSIDTIQMPELVDL